MIKGIQQDSYDAVLITNYGVGEPPTPDEGIEEVVDLVLFDIFFRPEPSFSLMIL